MKLFNKRYFNIAIMATMLGGGHYSLASNPIDEGQLEIPIKKNLKTEVFKEAKAIFEGEIVNFVDRLENDQLFPLARRYDSKKDNKDLVTFFINSLRGSFYLLDIKGNQETFRRKFSAEVDKKVKELRVLLVDSVKFKKYFNETYHAAGQGFAFIPEDFKSAANKKNPETLSLMQFLFLSPKYKKMIGDSLVGGFVHRVRKEGYLDFDGNKKVKKFATKRVVSTILKPRLSRIIDSAIKTSNNPKHIEKKALGNMKPLIINYLSNNNPEYFKEIMTKKGYAF